MDPRIAKGAYWRAVAIGLTLAGAISGPAVAARPFADDRCAVVIASSASLAEVIEWVLAHPQYRADTLLVASNGAFAASAGVIAKTGWRDTVAALKQQGAIPADAYCSARITSVVSAEAITSALEAEWAKADAQEEMRLERENAAREIARARREAAEARRLAEAAIAEAETARRQMEEQATATAARAEADAHRQVSGSGFRINAEGVLLTNEHVVDGCTATTADGVAVDVIDRSATFDLAVLRPRQAADGPWLPFSPDPPRLNAEVTIAGYPLHGLLGGINVTRGTVTSLRGIFRDDATMQISAPIQNGNSGGAVSDAHGRVIGIVVAKLDSDALKEVAGMTAENVNFAIRGDVAMLMLDRAGIAYETSPHMPALAPEDLADRLTAATALILCE